eukprot:jgi/Mesvir1/23835/Mv10640-RA.1
MVNSQRAAWHTTSHTHNADVRNYGGHDVLVTIMASAETQMLYAQSHSIAGNPISSAYKLTGAENGRSTSCQRQHPWFRGERCGKFNPVRHGLSCHVTGSAPVALKFAASCNASAGKKLARQDSGLGTAAAKIKSLEVEKRAYHNANFPVDDVGRTYHVGCKKGEVSNRILSVGDSTRAKLIASMLEPMPAFEDICVFQSSRGFNTYTGLYEGVVISIISTGMGIAMMDFLVRESRAVVDGPMAFIRLGTCGILQPVAALGGFVVASKGSVVIRREPDYFEHVAAASGKGSKGSDEGKNGNGVNGSPLIAGMTPPAPREAPYRISRPVPADAALSALVYERLMEVTGAVPGDGQVVEAMNATADSFYSSQGRITDDFDDHNRALLRELVTEHPQILSLEMETFHLLDLARCSRPDRKIYATAVAIGLAQRQSNEFCTPELIRQRELQGGQAVLEALARAQL